MTEIIDLDARRRHTAGSASCISCQHEWVAVAPVGTDVLECPSCHLDTGVHFTAREVDLIRALERIKTGHSGEGMRWDIAAMRQIASDTLAAIGWPPNGPRA